MSVSYSTKLVLPGVMRCSERHHHLHRFQPGNQDLSLTGSPSAVATPGPSKLRQCYLPDNSWISPFFSVVCVTIQLSHHQSVLTVTRARAGIRPLPLSVSPHSPSRLSPVYSPALAHRCPEDTGPAWCGLCPPIQAHLSKCHQATLATV